MPIIPKKTALNLLYFPSSEKLFKQQVILQVTLTKLWINMVKANQQQWE
jgi:hypothetical protein